MLLARHLFPLLLSDGHDLEVINARSGSIFVAKLSPLLPPSDLPLDTLEEVHEGRSLVQVQLRLVAVRSMLLDEGTLKSHIEAAHLCLKLGADAIHLALALSYPLTQPLGLVRQYSHQLGEPLKLRPMLSNRMEPVALKKLVEFLAMRRKRIERLRQLILLAPQRLVAKLVVSLGSVDSDALTEAVALEYLTHLR